MVKVGEIYEKFFGKYGDHHLCVSKAMQKNLKDEFNVDAHVLYDRAHSKFHRLNMAEKHILYDKIFPETNDFTEEVGSRAAYREDRSLLIVSSTSYTADEDFMVMIEALDYVESYITVSEKDLPSIRVVVTGKGPQKAEYERLF